ncbi:MAG: dephospho-CoA kinase [Acidobacteria bacterium]|jgi:dephospho-CoA kinase|nr:dephospho-CoA kinase [Acidobacteriota bacterium]
MLRVAMTGGIGTGKSAVLVALAELGTPVLDADPLAHSVIARATPGAAAVRMRFGEQVLFPDGNVDRRKLGQIVFGDDQARRDLEAIIHPEVYRTIQEWMAAQAARGSVLAVAEIQLLFEIGKDGDFDRTVVVACEPETQVRRVMRRSKLPESEVRQRVAAQMPLDEKVRRASYVIWTDGTLDDTRSRTTAVWQSLMRDAGAI